MQPVAHPLRHDDPAASGARLLTIAQVCARVSLSERSVYDAIAVGHFPKQVKLSPRRVAWIEDEIDAWLAARIAARGSK